MHYTLAVALPGSLEPHEVKGALEETMDLFDENREVELHRDTRIYADKRDVVLERARKWAVDPRRTGDPLDLTGKTEEEILEWFDEGTTYDDEGYPLTTSNPDGHWDWYQIGGRWAYAWVLKDEEKQGPLSFSGGYPNPDLPEHDRPFTDNARLCDIEPESIKPVYSYITLDKQFKTKWIGPATSDEKYEQGVSKWEHDQVDWDLEFYVWLQSLPRDTWLVHIDYHS